MPADTLQDMVLGFAVIIASLLGYALSLNARIRKAKEQHKTINKD